MNLRHIEAFRALMVAGSASRAADLLGVTQPAVSRAVSELEAELGFALFHRGGNRLVPTPEGEALYEDVALAYAGIERVRSTAARIRELGTGDLRIASLPALGERLVPQAVAAVLRAFPKLRISVQIIPSTTVRQLVSAGQCDIGLVADETDLHGIDHQIFARFRAVCVLSPGHHLATKAEVTAADLAGVPFIAPGPDDNSRHKIERIFAERGISRTIVAEAYSSALCCQLALEGAGVAIVNPMVAESFVARGLVVKPFLPQVILTTCIIFPPQRQPSRAAMALVRHLRSGVEPSQAGP